jgi:hypothetical protein
MALDKYPKLLKDKNKMLICKETILVWITIQRKQKQLNQNNAPFLIRSIVVSNTLLTHFGSLS